MTEFVISLRLYIILKRIERKRGREKCTIQICTRLYFSFAFIQFCIVSFKWICFLCIYDTMFASHIELYNFLHLQIFTTQSRWTANLFACATQPCTWLQCGSLPYILRFYQCHLRFIVHIHTRISNIQLLFVYMHYYIGCVHLCCLA